MVLKRVLDGLLIIKIILKINIYYKITYLEQLLFKLFEELIIISLELVEESITVLLELFEYSITV